jgi:hypothetical protein
MGTCGPQQPQSDALALLQVAAAAGYKGRQQGHSEAMAPPTSATGIAKTLLPDKSWVS